MGHSFVEFRGECIHLHDLAIDNVVRLMKRELLLLFEPAAYPTFLRDQFAAWEDAIEYSGVGCIRLPVDEFLCDDERIDLNLRLLDAAERTIEAFGEYIPRQFMQTLWGRPRWKWTMIWWIELLMFREDRYRDVKADVVLRPLREFKCLLEAGRTWVRG